MAGHRVGDGKPEPVSGRSPDGPGTRRSRLTMVVTALVFAAAPIIVPALLLRTGGGLTSTGPTRPAPTSTRPPDAPPARTTVAATSRPPGPGPTVRPLTTSAVPTATVLVPAPAPAPAPPGRPNLVVVSVATVPASPRAGDQVLFSAVIRNAGTAATPAGTIHGVVFLIDGLTQSHSASSSRSLAPGERRTYTVDSGPPTIWTATAGSHRLSVWVDDIDRITESDEGDNILDTRITVT